MNPDSRDLSCLLLCSLLLKARLQNWHLYFFSAPMEVFRIGEVEPAERTAAEAGGMLYKLSSSGEGEGLRGRRVAEGIKTMMVRGYPAAFAFLVQVYPGQLRRRGSTQVGKAATKQKASHVPNRSRAATAEEQLVD